MEDMSLAPEVSSLETSSEVSLLLPLNIRAAEPSWATATPASTTPLVGLSPHAAWSHVSSSENVPPAAPLGYTHKVLAASTYHLTPSSPPGSVPSAFTLAGTFTYSVARQVAAPSVHPASFKVAGTSAGAYSLVFTPSLGACSCKCHVPVYVRDTPSPRSGTAPEGVGRTAAMFEPLPLNENLGPTFTEASLEQLRNIEVMLVTFEASRPDRSREVRPSQPWNMPLMLTAPVGNSKVEKSGLVRALQPSNMQTMSVAFEASRLRTFVRPVQPANMPCMFTAPVGNSKVEKSGESRALQFQNMYPMSVAFEASKLRTFVRPRQPSNMPCMFTAPIGNSKVEKSGLVRPSQ